MAFKPTPRQQNALDARGAVLVSAAAGSGKTAVLSNRVAMRVMDSNQPIDICDMLIVTFTNAAAAQMRERISMVLSDCVRDNPMNPRALEQKAALDSASICTVDSFCIELVRDNFELAGMNPDFKIASNDQLNVMENKAVNEVVSRFLLTQPERFTSLAQSIGAEYGYDSVKNAVLKIYHYTRSLPFPESWLDRAAELYSENDFNSLIWTQPLYDYAFDTADFHYSALTGALMRIVDDEVLNVKYKPALENLRTLFFSVRESAANKNYDDIRTLLGNFAVVPLSAARNADEQTKEYAKRVFDSAKAALKDLTVRFSSPLNECVDDIKEAGKCVSVLTELVKSFSEHLDELKKQKNLYGFADIEHAALRLLCEYSNGEIRVKNTELNTRYKEVLVDEYQDTNDLQDAIFYALSDCGKNLFLVGDVKQSIYRFRRANPNNFIEKKEAYPEYDGTNYPSKISLSGNFRSRPDICAFTNFVFGLLMTKQSADMDYLAEDELIPLGNFADNAEAAVELHIVDCDSDAEADYVAEYIRKALDSGMQVSDGNGGLRKATYSDFTILLRSCKNSAQAYISAMKKLAIPAWTDVRGDFFSREEIMIALSLLRAVDNPLRDVELLATLMSPIYLFSAEEVAQMRLCAPNGKLYTALVKFAETNSKAANFLEKLNRYRAWCATVSAEKFISMVFDDTGLSAIVRSMDDGAARRANLFMLREYAARYEETGFKGITAFLRYIESAQNNGIEIPSACVTDSEDVVRLLSIHKSKGLQTPVCIVAGLSEKFNLRDSSDSITMHEKYGIGLRICDDTKAVRYDTLPRMIISAEETRASVAEEMRLIYVAMTRAQDKLVLVSADSGYENAVKKAGSLVASNWALNGDKLDSYIVKSVRRPADWLYMASLLHPDCEQLRELACAELNCADTTSRVKLCFGESIGETVGAEQTECEFEEKDFSEYLDFEYRNKQLLNIEAKYSVSRLTKSIADSQYSCTARPAFVSNDELNSAEKGTATHEFMCFADYELAQISVANEVKRLVEIGMLSEKKGRAIDIEAVDAFFRSDIYSRIKSADRVLRESRFIYEMPVTEISPDCNSDETVVVQGVADCVIFEPDGIVILDFKTDRNCTAEQLKAKYRRQLKVYSDAFSYNYHIPAKPSYIYSFALREAIELDEEN